MKPKLIAADVDGTLLNSAGELTERTVSALREAEKQGIRTMLATGRMCCSGLVLARKLGMTAPCVFYNGSIIMNPVTEEIYFRQELDAGLVSRVLAYYRKKGWYIQKYVNDTLCVVDSSDERTQYYTAITKVTAVSLGEKFWTEPSVSTKLLVCAKETEDCAPMFEETKRVFGSELYVVGSWKRIFELVHPNVNKARAVAQAAEILGITQEDTICFGDSGNDNEMLRWAGLGVAMGNSGEETKRAADAVADTNDRDGLAKFVESLLA
ncbi:MAG: HAD family phosphatase [Synergistaceae bacterium]|nr:HAD family phosphatase [Candidatus Equadaptatus faecalis]